MPLSISFTTALTNARKPGFSALVFSDVKKIPASNSADYKQAAAEDLGRMGLTARTQDIFYGRPTGRDSDRKTMAMKVVAEADDDADRFVQ